MLPPSDELNGAQKGEATHRQIVDYLRVKSRAGSKIHVLSNTLYNCNKSGQGKQERQNCFACYYPMTIKLRNTRDMEKLENLTLPFSFKNYLPHCR